MLRVRILPCVSNIECSMDEPAFDCDSQDDDLVRPERSCRPGAVACESPSHQRFASHQCDIDEHDCELKATGRMPNLTRRSPTGKRMCCSRGIHCQCPGRFCTIEEWTRLSTSMHTISSRLRWAMLMIFFALHFFPWLFTNNRRARQLSHRLALEAAI